MTWRRQRSVPWPLNSLRNSSARSGSSLEVAAAPCSPLPFPMSESGCSGCRWLSVSRCCQEHTRSARSRAAISTPPSPSACAREAAFPPHCCCLTSRRKSIGGLCGAGVLYFIASGNAGLQPCRRVRLQRLRRALTRRIFACGGARVRSRDDVHVPGVILGRHTNARQPGSQASRSASHSR